MASTSCALNMEKLNGNNFHTWKVTTKFFLHEIFLQEITSKELLPLEVEFGEIVCKGITLEHHLFMKKDKLTYGTIFLNVVDYLLHHVTHVEIVKDAWYNLCATFERINVGKRL
jgi:hypothetical protein